MSNKMVWWREVMVGAVFLLAVLAAPALAGDDEQPRIEAGEESEQLEEETGAHVHVAHLDSAIPVYHVDPEALRFQGTVRVEDMLRTLPQVFSGQNGFRSFFATNTATLNLRNLGSKRTLILINGRRLPAGSPSEAAVAADLNQIPAALIKNIDVLTGGGSTVYGADAVAGVINFRMVDDFEGVKLDYQFSQYQHDNDNAGFQRIVRDAGYEVPTGSTWDGDISNVSLIMGKKLGGGRGNVTVYGTHRNINPVLQGDRDYSTCVFLTDLTGCDGSSVIPQGRFAKFGDQGFDYKLEGHEFVPRAGTLYNYQQPTYSQRSDTRWTAGLFAHYDVHERVEAYTEFMFMQDRTVAQIAPSPEVHPITLNCGHPLLSPQQFDAICGSSGLTKEDRQDLFVLRRSVESGNRQDDSRHTSYRGVLGLRGDLSEHWHYEAHAQYSEVRLKNVFRNQVSDDLVGNALDAVTHPETGETVCRSVLDGSDPSDPNCVPWNVFREGAVTPEMVDYLRATFVDVGSTDQTVVSGYLNGHLGDYGLRSPFARTGVDVVLGGEYRAENFTLNPQIGSTFSRGFDVTEVFMETGIPLIEDAPFAEELGLDVSYRYSDYNYGLQTNTFGARSEWAINSSVRLRASFQRAIRGPNVWELFDSQGLVPFDLSTEPCSGPVTGGKTAAGRTFEECARTGVTAEQFGQIAEGPGNQYNYLTGGNPDLKAEESDSYSFGLVWTPRFLKGFHFSVDYYSIRISGGISNLSPEFILNECLNGNVSQCANVRRGPNGNLWGGEEGEDLEETLARSGHVVALRDNLGIENVRGYDITAGYHHDAGEWGRLDFNDVLSITAAWERQELEGAPTIDCAGKWGSLCNALPNPTMRNNLRATWVTPWGIRPSLLWRYISGVEGLGANEVDLGERHYFDLAVIWEDFIDNVSLRVGVNNLFDREPPITENITAGPALFGNDVTFPSLYDVLGRYVFFGVTARFD